MGYIRVCDLCGKPMREISKTYRIKRWWYSWHGSGWTTIEAHDECVKRLINALDDKREAEGKRLMADTITTTGTGSLYSNYCYNRLPCGVCRILMCQCPVFNGCGVTPVPTWNPNEVTCKAEEEE